MATVLVTNGKKYTVRNSPDTHLVWFKSKAMMSDNTTVIGTTPATKIKVLRTAR